MSGKTENKDRAAFANGSYSNGLNKREYIATQILAGLAARPYADLSAARAIKAADELLAALEKKDDV